VRTSRRLRHATGCLYTAVVYTHCLIYMPPLSPLLAHSLSFSSHTIVTFFLASFQVPRTEWSVMTGDSFWRHRRLYMGSARRTAKNRGKDGESIKRGSIQSGSSYSARPYSFFPYRVERKCISVRLHNSTAFTRRCIRELVRIPFEIRSCFRRQDSPD